VQFSLRKIATLSRRAATRIGAKAIPRKLRKSVEDRIFYAIFNLTRVTNDHYPAPGTQSQKED
jgi:hypothetical protein